MKKRLYILLAAGVMAAAASAQTATIRSQVKATNGQPVIGAIVTVAGEKNSVLTDDGGSFELKTADEDAIVTIKADGFYERALPLRLLKRKGDDANFQITLVPQGETLYDGKAETPYATLSRNERSGTISAIENKDFTGKLAIGAAMRDQLSGLQVIEKSGMPGEGTYMNLRGIHSFVADNAPLIVINGVPYFGQRELSGIINGYSRDMLFGYSPKDIRSVTVLKGADAAIYGSLGSNGVIMIETQQATSDNLETRISFSGQYGLNMRGSSIPMMDATQYRSYMGAVGMSAYPSFTALTADYPFLQNTQNLNSYLFNENTDWLKEIQHTGFQTENIFRVEGGDEIAKYNISFGYTSNGGTLRETKSDRYHTLISSDVMVSRKVDITANVGLAYVNSNLHNQGMRPEVNPLLAAQRSMPLVSAYSKQTDGSVLPIYAKYNAWQTSSIPYTAYNDVSNPLALVNTAEGTDKIYDANAQLGLNYNVNDYLKLSALVGIYYNYTEETMFIPGVSNQTIIPQLNGTGRNQVSNGVIRQTLNNYQLQGRYNRTFNNIHEFSAVATARLMRRNLEYDWSTGYNTANDWERTLDKTNDEKSTTGDNILWNYMGYNVHADYTWNRILRGQLGLAVDGTSVTGDDAARFGFFPSAGVTFMAANTGALPSLFNRLNVSLEASISGNSRFSSNYGKSYYVSRSFSEYGIGTITRANMPNTKLSWEKKRQLDLALDASLLNGRLDLGVAVYASESYDLLLNSGVSNVYGSTAFYENTGKISGKGLEVSLRVAPIETRDFGLVIAGTFSTLKNTVKSLGGADSYLITYTDYNHDDARVLMAVDEKPYQFYGYQTNGIYSTAAEALASNLVNSSGMSYQAGDVRFVDQNGDNVINSADMVALGSTLPTMFGGFNIMVRYRQFTLDANFGYTLGGKVYNGTRRDAESMETFYNQATSALNRWQVEGQSTNMPRASYKDAIGNNLFSDRWIEKGDYLKLRSVRLAYNFEKVLSFVRSGNVFVAAENLFTLTKYLGYDPEFAYSYDESLRGFDYAKLALPMTLKVGFNLNF
jgi:TonB-linked SusC/RagA family outer membrane protein